MSNNHSLSDNKQRQRKQLTLSILLFFTFSFMTFAFAQLGHVEENSRPVEERMPASLDKKIKNSKALPSFIHTKKLDVPIKAYIEKEGSLNIEAGEPFVLRGHFQISTFSKKAEVEWVLPKGISLVQGAASQTFMDIPANQPQISEVVLISDRDDNLQIHFKVGMQSSHQRFAVSSQYNTTMQEEINISKAELKLRMDEYSEKLKKKSKLQIIK
ncbi:MAG: hypothetical protein KDD61_07045 [Bdellovibrionales bacterium]|nr:hypothetical protein [Bdellovibrionales bacterium]